MLVVFIWLLPSTEERRIFRVGGGSSMQILVVVANIHGGSSTTNPSNRWQFYDECIELVAILLQVPIVGSNSTTNP